MPKYVLRAPLLKIGNDVQSVSHLIQKINITTDSGSLYGHRGDEAISSTLTALYRIDGQKEIGILHTSILHLLLTSFCSNSDQGHNGYIITHLKKPIECLKQFLGYKSVICLKRQFIRLYECFWPCIICQYRKNYALFMTFFKTLCSFYLFRGLL